MVLAQFGDRVAVGGLDGAEEHLGLRGEAHKSSLPRLMGLMSRMRVLGWA
jgi:hypothetical protein